MSSLYIKTFSTNENGLVLDFAGVRGVTFKTGYDCVVVRRDTFEVIEIPENTKIKLNKRGVKGYTEVKDTKIIIIDGNEIEISFVFCESIIKK